MATSLCPTFVRPVAPHAARLDARLGQSRGARTSALASESKNNSLGPVVVNVPPPRASTSPPQPVPIVHSPAYLYQMGVTELKSEEEKQQEEEEEAAAPSSPVHRSSRTNSASNPFEKALASADDMLNEMERNPDPTTQAIWKATNSIAGQTAAKGVRGAAEFTVKAGTEAIKIAAPIGAWAMKQGVRAGFDLVSKMNEKRSERTKKRQD